MPSELITSISLFFLCLAGTDSRTAERRLGQAGNLLWSGFKYAWWMFGTGTAEVLVLWEKFGENELYILEWGLFEFVKPLVVVEILSELDSFLAWISLISWMIFCLVISLSISAWFSTETSSLWYDERLLECFFIFVETELYLLEPFLELLWLIDPILQSSLGLIFITLGCVFSLLPLYFLFKGVLLETETDLYLFLACLGLDQRERLSASLKFCLTLIFLIESSFSSWGSERSLNLCECLVIELILFRSCFTRDLFFISYLYWFFARFGTLKTCSLISVMFIGLYTFTDFLLPFIRSNKVELSSFWFGKYFCLRFSSTVDSEQSVCVHSCSWFWLH